MPVLTEPPSMGDVLKYEVNPNYTREVVTLLAGMPYPMGAVLGCITASGKYKLATSGGTDGAQADRTLGGQCDWVEPEAPASVDLPVEGTAAVKAAVITVVLHFTTTGPLA